MHIKHLAIESDCIKMSSSFSRKELEDKIKQATEFHREIQDKIEAINNLNQQVSVKLEAGPGLTEQQQSQKKELLNSIQLIVDQLFQKRQYLSSLQTNITKTSEAINIASANRITIKDELDKISYDLSSVLDAIHTEQSTNIALQRDKVELERSIQQELHNNSSRERYLQELHESHKTHQSECKKIQSDIIISHKEESTIDEECKRIAQELDTIRISNQSTTSDNDGKSKMLRLKEDEVKSINKRCIHIKHEINAINEKIQDIQNRSNESVQTHDEMSMKLHRLEKNDLPLLRRDWEVMQNEIERLRREENSLDIKSLTSEKKTGITLDLIHAQETRFTILENELRVTKRSIEQKKKAVNQLKNDQESKARDIENILIRCNELKQLMQEQDTITHLLETQIEESEKRAKEEHDRGSSTKSESNRESKALHDNQEKLEKLFNEYNTIQRQMKSCQHDMVKVENDLIIEHSSHYTCDLDAEELRKSVSALRNEISSTASILEHQLSDEIREICEAINNAKDEDSKLNKEHLLLMTERDGVIVQLSQSEIELVRIREAISGRKLEMKTCDEEFEHVTKQQSGLTCRIQTLHRQLLDVTNDLKNQQDRIRTCTELENQIRNIQCESKLLQEELRHPINIHRWRILEQRDPSTFEKMHRLHKDQRKLIEIRDEVMDMDRIISEKKKILNEIKSYMEGMPNPSVLEEELNVMDTILKERQDEYKKITKDMDYYRRETERLGKINQGLKCRLLKDRKEDWISCYC